MNQLILVGIGGCIGAIARYGVSFFIRQNFPNQFPVATLVVNILGCFTIGFLIRFFHEHPLEQTVNLFLVVGILGAFTTFSAFSLETIELFKNGLTSFAVLNVMASVLLCLGAVVTGMWLGALRH